MSAPPMPANVEVLDTPAGPAVTINGSDPIPLHPQAEVSLVPGDGGRYVTLVIAVDKLTAGGRPSVATPEGRASRVWGANAGDERIPAPRTVARA